MTEFLIANLAPLMFASLIVFLILGFPVAFSLGANGIFFGLIGIALGLLHPSLFSAIPERIFGGVMANETLLAIPFFTFMGFILERSGIAEDLLNTIGKVFGPVRGGLAYAVVLVGAILAATVGVVAATVISMGLISLPIMLRYGYDRRVATGVIAASGTLAQIIPPSLVLVILADQLGRSVGDLYRAAFLPGFILVGLYLIYVFVISVRYPQAMPALPKEMRPAEADGKSGYFSTFVLLVVAACAAIFSSQIIWLINHPLSWISDKLHLPDPGALAIDEMIVVDLCVASIVAYVLALVNRWFKLGLLSQLAEQVTFVLIPPLALIFLVLGTIFLGIATPTEGAAMGATGALVMALCRRRLTTPLLRQAMDGTARLTTFVLFILVGARIFSLTFYGINGHVWVEHLLTSLPGGQTGFLIVVNIMIFLLAFFLDFFELCFIVVPLLSHAAVALGIDTVWLGVVIAVNLQTSFMHPPFGFALFYLRSVAPTTPYVDRLTGKSMSPVTTAQIYWGAIPFLIIQLLMVILLILFPNIARYSDKPISANTGAVSAPAQDLDLRNLINQDSSDAPATPHQDSGEKHDSSNSSGSSSGELDLGKLLKESK